MNTHNRVRQHTEPRPQGRRYGPQPALRAQWSGGGNARAKYERYVALARDARTRGDLVEMENCYQHAEHYFREMRGDGHERRG